MSLPFVRDALDFGAAFLSSHADDCGRFLVLRIVNDALLVFGSWARAIYWLAGTKKRVRTEIGIAWD